MASVASDEVADVLMLLSLVFTVIVKETLHMLHNTMHTQFEKENSDAQVYIVEGPGKLP